MVADSMTTAQTSQLLDVIIIGAGVGGLAAGVMVRDLGQSFQILDRGTTVGGTWRDNTYPGCACDVPSHLYSLSFAQNPDWTRSYPRQPEIEAYLESVTDSLDLRRSIEFGCEITELRWDGVDCFWVVTTSDGTERRARSVIMATGPLSRPSLPDIEGLESFGGKLFHSARWDHSHDLDGARIAVIGTGASAIQFVPEIAPLARKVTVFQRTPPWVLPRDDRPAPQWRRSLYRAIPALQRLHRWRVYLRQEMLSAAFVGRGRTARGLADRIKAEVRSQIETSISDPALREKLIPDYEPGCKRLLISNDWYPALARENVEVCVESVVAITPSGVVTSDGVEHAVDTIILGTGFAASDFPGPVRILGERCRDLAERWRDGAATHLGITVDGFPNLYYLAGPNTGLGHNSIIFMIEAQLHHVRGAMRHQQRRGSGATTVSHKAVSRFYDEVQRRLDRTVWTTGCSSWYRSAAGQVDTLWPGTTVEYWARTRWFRPSKYRSVCPDSGTRLSGR
jgi:cation diffusion facilitator CzcD-associated flavoprotein CzcO